MTDKKEYDEMFPDEEKPGGASLSAVLKDEEPKPEPKPKKVIKMKEVKEDDLKEIHNTIRKMRDDLSSYKSIHRIWIAIDSLEKEYRKKLLK